MFFKDVLSSWLELCFISRLNEFWAKPLIADHENILRDDDENKVCQPDKIKSEKWYRNIVSARFNVITFATDAI